MPIPFKLSAAEEGVALDYLSGVDFVASYRKNYPNSKVADFHAKGKIKEILKRERVKAYIEQVKLNGDMTNQISETSIKKYLLETMMSQRGTRIGLDAALALGKEFGIGTQTVVIKEERAYDQMLLELHNYNTAKINGEDVKLPDCLAGRDSVTELIEFEIVEEDIDDN